MIKFSASRKFLGLAAIPQLLRIAVILGLLLAMVSGKLHAQCDVQVKGGEFWFVAPEVDQLHGDEPIFLRITSYTEPVTATLSMPARASFTPIVVNIPAGGYHSIDLTAYKGLIESSPFNAVLNTGMLLEVTGVATAYYEVASTVNPAIFNFKGEVGMGRHFFIPAQTAFVNNTSLPGRSGFVVVAAEDNTTVTIHPKNDMVGHPLSEGSFNITLNRGQTWSALATGFNPSHRLNGTEVQSNKPIAVTIFDDNVFVPGHYDLCGDQLVPTGHIGTEYIAIRGNGGSNERIIVLATENSTQVFVDGAATAVATLNKGEQYSRSFSGAAHYIRSSKPTYVMHMAGIGGELGHAQMPPIGCSGVSEMGFVRTSAGQFGLMILAPAGSEGSFEINGNSSLIAASAFNNVPGTGGAWKAYYVNLNLPVGQNFIRNTTANFHMAILNNLGASTVYGYYTRFGLTQPNLGPDQIACNRNLFPMTLQSRISADEFLWSDGTSSPNMVVDEPGTYWVRSRASGCLDQYDSISIVNFDARLLGTRKIEYCGSFTFNLEGHFAGSDEGSISVHLDSLDAIAGINALPSLTVLSPGTYFVRLETECACYSVRGFNLQSICPPIAVNDSYTTPEDTPINMDVLANDSDPDGSIDPSSMIITELPQNGIASVNPDGSILYVPNQDWHGIDTLIYQISDNDGLTAQAVVIITVLSVNDPPVAEDDFATTPEDTPVTIDVLANDSDPDHPINPANVAVTLPPSHGTAVVNADGTVTYTPAANWYGTDVFTYQYCDDEGACDQALVTVEVTDVNDAPVVQDDVATTPEDTPVIVLVLANDYDIDGTLDVSSVAVLSPPSNGTAVVNPDGSITYTPNENWFGLDSLLYQVCDDDGACGTATVYITVTDVNDAPVALDDAASTPEDVAVIIAVLDNDYDVDGELVLSTLTVLSGPSNGSVVVNPDGTITYTPAPDYYGSDSFVYQICDDDGDCASAVVSIDVLDVNDPPIAVDDVVITPEDTAVTTQVLLNDYDVDGTLDPATVVIISAPSHGSAVVNPDGSITYTPNENYYGPDAYVYQVCDDDGACDQATVSITVTPVNDAPVAVDDSDTTNEDTPVSTAVMDNDYDVDGSLDPASVTVITGPANGTAYADPLSGEITYTPDPNWFGVDSYVYQVCDFEGACDQATVTITVISVNDAPVALDDHATTPEDTPVNIAVLSNDYDIDGTLVIASLSIVSGPAHGTVQVNADGTVTYTPDLNYFGIDSFVYQICDDEGACDQATVVVEVLDVNDPPVAVDDVASTDEDTPVTIAVLDNDSDVDGTLVISSLSVISGPSHGTVLVNADGTITYTPGLNYFGSDSFVYQICDDDGACDQATVSISVLDVNDPPIAMDDVYYTLEDEPVTMDVLDNDSDVDGTLVISSLAIISGPSHGTLIINPDGSITYTPELDYNGDDEFVYQICDDDGACDQATVLIHVGPVNDPPVAVDDVVVTPEDTPVNTFVLANDYDVDGELILSTLVIISGPAHGTATVNSDGSITYTPYLNYFGPDSYVYQICDEDGSCDVATVFITVTPVNDPPVAMDDVVTTPEDSSVIIAVLANDSDVDSELDLNSLTVISGPSNGTVLVNADGTITYSPSENYFGPDEFVYQICDVEGLCDQATVFITVTPVNDPPIAVDDYVVTPEDTPVTTAVLENDSDIDGTLDLSSLVVISGPAHGSVVVNPDGTITYTPNANYFGPDSYIYQICDNEGDCASATVHITVLDVNDPPFALDDVDVTQEDTPVTTIVLANDYDIDGSLVISSVEVISAPANGTAVVNPDGSITYTPNPDWFGVDSYTYQVCDDDGDCDQAVVTITVISVNDPPVAVDDVDFTLEDTPVSTAVLENDYDIDGSLVISTLQVLTPPSHGSTVVNPDGTITYTPEPDWFGVDTYTYQICDNEGLCASATVTITVQPVNDSPVAVDDVIHTPEDTPVSADILNNDFDIDSELDVSSLVIISDPSNGTVVVNPDGSITYTPNPDWFGTDQFEYVICDVEGLCDSATVTVHVSPVNDAPVAVDDVISTPEDTPVNIPVLDNDYDIDGWLLPGSVLITGVPSNGLVSVHPDGSVTYYPNPNWFGTDTFYYQVCDNEGLCDQAIVIVHVLDVNDPPVAVKDVTGTPEDTPVTIPVLNNDYDIDGVLDTSSVVILLPPSNGTAVVNPDGSITYTPNPDWFGIDTLGYQVCDDDAACDSALVIIHVLDVNDPPIAVDDVISTPEDVPVAIDITANDYDIDGYLVVPGSLVLLTSPSNGSVSLGSDGVVTYTPTPHWHGVDSFQYSVCDDDGACDNAWVYITVVSVDDPPLAVDDFVMTPEDTPILIDPLANDSDPDGDIDPETLVIISGPSNGTATVDPSTGEVLYSPDANWYGLDTMLYVICDATGLCDTAQIIVLVNPVPDAPVAVDDYATTPEDVPVTIEILANDFDVETDINPASVTILTDPHSGSVLVHPDGTVTYTPVEGFYGTDSFQYLVCDFTDLCDDAWVYVTIAEIPVALVAVDDEASTPEEIPVNIAVLDNDIPGDYPIDPATMVILLDPLFGSVSSEPGSGIVQYSPQAGWCGVDQFLYRICDTWGYCDSAWVTISVECISLVANDDVATTPMGEPVRVVILLNDSPNADPECVTIIDEPLYGTVVVEADGSVIYTPQVGFVGEDCFRYEVCDEYGVKRDDALVCVTIEEVDLTIPEVFTPNGDGFNESFQIVGIEQFPNNQMMIFNRWENLVFQADGYMGEWTGTNMQNGEKLPDGTYFYVLVLDPKMKDSPVFKGFIAIQR